MIDPLEFTASHQIRERLGLPDKVLPLDQRDALVEDADRRMVARMGRHLSPEERSLAERQTYFVAAGFNSPELGIAELLDAGISVPLQARAANGGIAVVHEDGSYEGDPEVARQGHAARAARAAFDYSRPAEDNALRGVPRGY